MERGKPRKRETQIMVGELLLVNERCSGPVMVDKYLPRSFTDRTRLISYFFIYEGVSILFAIGNSLKEAREKTGVSLEEASLDIQIKSVILENIEEGNIGSFKDIFELKEYLCAYAKYLGLDENKILDEFNEYMFEYTSKIPLKDIEKKVMEQNKEKEVDSVVSPYTKPMKKYPAKYYIVLYTVLILLAIAIIFWSIHQITVSKYLESFLENLNYM